MKNIKLYKLSVILLGLAVLVNLSFCLAPFISLTNASTGSEVAVSENIQTGKDKSASTACEDPNQNKDADTQEAKAAKSNHTPSNNAVLPCCQDHGKTAKIDNTAGFKIQNIAAQAIVENNVFNDKAKIQSSSYVNTLDPPPPEPDILSSVFKKE